MELHPTKPAGKKPENYPPRILGDEVQRQLQSQHAEIARAANNGSVNLVKANEVEERERYRYQWRKEDRQRIVSDRLELGVAVVTGALMGLVSGGGIMGGATGFLIWFATGLVRNRWSP